MRYRVYKTHRLLKAYKIQAWEFNGWVDQVKLRRIRDEVIVFTKYYWTAKQAVKEIEKDPKRESLYE